jgi:hypothetical protein
VIAPSFFRVHTNRLSTSKVRSIVDSNLFSIQISRLWCISFFPHHWF